MQTQNVVPAEGATGEAEQVSESAAASSAENEEAVAADGSDAEATEDGAETQDAETKADDETTEANGAATEAKGKHKRVGGFQRKIQSLERQNQILLDQLQRAGVQPAQPAAAQQKTDAEKAAEYLDQLVDKRLAQRDAQRQATEVQARFQERMEAARAAHDDFEDVVMSVSHMQTSAALHQALLTSERGPEIMYQLAKNPAELARISALPPLDAAREVGRLEAKASGATPQTRPAARPPPPPSRVAGSTSSTRRLEDLPLAEYKKAMRSDRR